MPPKPYMASYNRYDMIRAGAKSFRGHCTWAFSQAQEPVYGIISGMPATHNGICMALSNRWIVDHSQGSALANWICTSNGGIDLGKVANLIFNFIDGLNEPITVNGAKSQHINAERYLWNYGIVRRTNIISGDRMTMEVPSSRASTHGMGLTYGYAIAKWGNRNALETYRLLTISGGGGSHAMAAYVSHDVAFFDPNYGEFWFESREDFIRWFAWFWNSSGYANDFQLGKIRDYAPKMGHVASRPAGNKGTF